MPHAGHNDAESSIIGASAANRASAERSVVSRRALIGALGGAGALVSSNVASRSSGSTAGAQSVSAFPDGVISGDPQPDGAVVWTRVSDPGGGVNVSLTCTVFADDGVTQLGSYPVTASAADGYCAHLAVGGLTSDSWFRYKFTSGGVDSPVGRFRTAPTPGSSPQHLRFAFVSCQQRSSPYVAHTALLSEGIDFLVHLGDYIYVSDTATISLDDYRGVWQQFRSDPALQELHRQVPLVAMWDDGEFYNGVDRTGDPARLAAARTAFFENMPVLRPSDDPDRLYRALSWGSLATVPVIDVRSYRDPAVEPTDNETPEGAIVMDPSRTTLGVSQRSWLMNEVGASAAIWRLVASGYNVLPVRSQDRDTPDRRLAEPNMTLNAGTYFPNEAFDDYQYERRQILQQISDDNIENVVFVSGHTHVFLGGRLYPDYDDDASPLVAHEFVCGSLTADPPPEGTVHDLLGTWHSREESIAILRTVETAGLEINAHLDYINLAEQGYAIVDVTPERVRVEFKVIDTFAENATPQLSWSYEVPAGTTPEPVTEPEPTTTTPATTTSTTTTPSTTTPSAPTTTTTVRQSPTATAAPATPRFTG